MLGCIYYKNKIFFIDQILGKFLEKSIFSNLAINALLTQFSMMYNIIKFERKIFSLIFGLLHWIFIHSLN